MRTAGAVIVVVVVVVVVVGGACEALTKLGIWKITIKSGKMAERPGCCYADP
jgi:hypothetical protein